MSYMVFPWFEDNAVIALYIYFYVHIHCYIKADGACLPTEKSLQSANHQGTSGAMKTAEIKEHAWLPVCQLGCLQ